MSGPLDNMTVVATLPDGRIETHAQLEGAAALGMGDRRARQRRAFTTNYYSLTDLAAKGTITLKGTAHDVTGVVWMDHEYGGWGASVKWYWQSMILDNGVRIMGFTGATPEIPVDKPLDGSATIQMPDGSEFLEPITMTPHEPIWTSETTGNRYFIKWTMAIPRLQRLPQPRQQAGEAGVHHSRLRQARAGIRHLRGRQHRERHLQRQGRRRHRVERAGAVGATTAVVGRP